MCPLGSSSGEASARADLVVIPVCRGSAGGHQGARASGGKGGETQKHPRGVLPRPPGPRGRQAGLVRRGPSRTCLSFPLLLCLACLASAREAKGKSGRLLHSCGPRRLVSVTRSPQTSQITSNSKLSDLIGKHKAALFPGLPIGRHLWQRKCANPCRRLCNTFRIAFLWRHASPFSSVTQKQRPKKGQFPI